ncbi:MAG TPA: hypothetical protein VGG39_18430 [Polyangiaceae bacterium]|jgi:hypothetical protein
MNVEAVDRVLADWEERLRRVDESLLALESDPTYQMVAPRGQVASSLEGETARVVLPALEALRDLFENRGRLRDVLERAKEVRASFSSLAFWGNEEKCRRIEELLAGASIELEPGSPPLSERGLLEPGAREVWVMPERLLLAMAANFERARDAVVAVGRAWESSEMRLVAMSNSIVAARGRASALGLGASVMEDLSAMEAEVQAAHVRLAKDPLAASRELAVGASARLAALEATLGKLAGLREQVTTQLRAAAATMADVRATRARALEAAERLPREVEGAGTSDQATDEGLVEGLGPWLAKIEAAAAAGRWPSAEVGLQRWNESARAYLTHDAGIAATLDNVVARREELAGRLSARRAQVTALQARGVVVPADAEDLAREADRLLSARPTPLARARALVERFESMVRR